MVLYKRKQVTFIRPPSIPTDLSTEIFIIPQTKEWFIEYEDYLARMDYYSRRKFVCEITGNSCLTFFEAYESERKEIRDLEANFPEALREHILKFLQFNRISRLDLLVDKVYSVFKNEYFPGEEVYVKKIISTVTDSNGTSEPTTHSYMSTVKQRGTIREKVQYSNPSDTKYLVSTLNDGSQIIATNQQIFRDRNHFTKWLIKTYVKLTVTRSPKVGAPWVVKDKFAKKYRIPSEYPDDLKHFENLTPSGEVLYEDDARKQESPTPALEGAETPKQKKARGKSLKKKATINAATAAGSVGIPLNEFISTKATPKNETRLRFPLHHLPTNIRKELENNELATISSFQPSKKTIIEDLDLLFDLQNGRPAASALELPENALKLQQQAAERLEEEVERLQESTDPSQVQELENNLKQIKLLKQPRLQSVQEALECWAFLNIYHSVLRIDTFTFDDFICAMGWNDQQFKDLGRCELLDEIWCAVLGLVVSNSLPPNKNADEGKVFGLQITLPPDLADLNEQSIKDEEGEDETSNAGDGDESNNVKKEESDGVAKSASPTPKIADPETSPKKNGNQLENGAAGSEPEAGPSDNEEEEEEEEEEEHSHNAYSVMNYRNVKWQERLRRRNYKDGNWQTIILGVLSLVEYVPEYEDIIEEVYHVLAPLSISPATPITVQTQFFTYLSIDLRLKVLHILTSLVVNGTAVRSYIDESIDETTSLRRTRLDVIRDLKSAVDGTNKIHTEIYGKLMEAVGKATDMSLWSSFSRKRHRLNTKGYEMTEYEKLVASSDEEFQKLWNDREAGILKIKEARNAKKRVEMKLSELNCQRVRLLGKDRHFNRYWWFENNGLPNLHYSKGVDDDEDQQEPESDDDLEDKDEVQEETYLMGRLWIQGPANSDLQSNFKMTPDEVEELVSTLEGHGDEGAEKANGAHAPPPEFQELDDGGQPLRIMDFSGVPQTVANEAEKHGLKFAAQSILSKNGSEVIDRLGGLPKDTDTPGLSVLQRKFIEERDSPIVSGSQWRFFDQGKDIEEILKWLNPWGKRESLLRKEFLKVKDGMIASISARRKALWLDKLPKEEAGIEDNIEAVKAKISTMEGSVEETEIEDSGDDVLPRKRAIRRVASGSVKRQKTTEDTLKTGTLDELRDLKVQLKEDLINKVKDNQTTRVMEWVNRAARDEFEKPLYEGGDKPRPKVRKGKK